MQLFLPLALISKGLGGRRAITCVKRRATSKRASSAVPLAACSSAKDLSGSELLPAQVDRWPALLQQQGEEGRGERGKWVGGEIEQVVDTQTRR